MVAEVLALDGLEVEIALVELVVAELVVCMVEPHMADLGLITLAAVVAVE
jgi:hypothetical protein